MTARYFFHAFRRLAAALLLTLGAALPAKAETLTDALILAFKNSHLLEQNRALMRVADEDVAQAVSALRPVLSFIASANYSTRAAPLGGLSSSAQLVASMTLFDFGARAYAVQAQKELVLATRAQLLQIEQQVLLNAVTAYMDMISSVETVALRQSNVRLITQELRAARDRFDVGEVTRTDVSIAEARLAGARANLAAAQGELEIARESYKAAIGQYPGTLRRPPPPPMTARNEAEAKRIAQIRHPNIAEAQANVRSAEFGVAQARASSRPVVEGTLGVGVDQRGPLQGTAGVSLTAPIYTGGRLSSVRRQAQARLDATRSGLLQTSLLVSQGVGNAWAQLAVAHASLQASDRQIRASQVAYNGVREEARLGARTTLDVLNAEQELLDARASRITAETNRYIAVYSLLSAMGMLTVDHLNLGLVTYDPEAYYNTVQHAPVGRVSPQGERLDRLLRSIGRE